MAALPGRHFFRNLIGKRTLLFQLVRRDFERRFVGSAVGWIWGVIHPLVQLACWTFVFHYALKMRVPPGQSTGNYTLFLFCGYLPWMLFQETVHRSSTCLVDNANLITKTLFPSEMIPISIYLSSLVNHLLAVALALAAIAVAGQPLSFSPVRIPLYLALLGLLSIGAGWIVASLQVYLRDTAQFTLVALNLGMWLTPIFMTPEQVPDRFRFLVLLNPLSYAVNAYRSMLLGGAALDLAEFAALAAFAIACFLGGGLVFRQLKRGFADVL